MIIKIFLGSGHHRSSGMTTSTASRANQAHIGKYKLLKTIGKGNFAKVSFTFTAYSHTGTNTF
jgi:hypothetical protein